MSIDPASVADIGTALAHPSRAAMCLALLDGRAWTVNELARAADVAKSTASEHLTALVFSGLLVEERQGRHRYMRLASHDAAHLVESVAAFSGRPTTVSSLRASVVREHLAQARTCYDHLAGALGVAIFESLVRTGALTTNNGLALTARGEALMVGVLGTGWKNTSSRQPVVRTCLDWTQRRHHLAGQLASSLRQCFVDREWVTPRSQHRALRVSETGAYTLQNTFEIDPGPWRTRDASDGD